MIQNVYPLAPAGIPTNHTSSSLQYRLRQPLAVLGGLFAFLLIYLALIVGIAYLAYQVFRHPPILPRGRIAILILVGYFGGIAVLLMLFLFLLKGLFKWNRTDRSSYLKLKRADQPLLFEFIDQICKETNAPRPSGVFLSPEVNAAVIYNTSLLNLIIPPRKHLLIGAGLVESINLREFKAVLAHEFGHFSQSSLTVGTYVFVANRVLVDMIYSRDAWDNVLRAWCEMDLRFSFPAYILRTAVRILRAFLGGIYRIINLLNMSLSQQMEFNADDVAVSVAGSDAIVTSLCKIEFADRCLEVVTHELKTAADHNIYTNDIFFHQTAAAKYVRAQAKKPLMGIPPAPPAQVFDPKDHTVVPEMWRTHPANHEREANAKRSYFPAPPDERSPWILFQNVPALKKELSLSFYEHTLNKPKNIKASEPKVVQAFIDAERSEMLYDPKYHGLFDDRALIFEDIPTVPEIDRRPEVESRMLAIFNNYPRPGFEPVMEKHAARVTDLEKLLEWENSEKNAMENSVSFRGRNFSRHDVPQLLEKVNREIDIDYEQFGDWDREMYVVHYQAANQLKKEIGFDLRRRYVFLKSVQDMVMKLNEQDTQLEGTLSRLDYDAELTESDMHELTSRLRTASGEVSQAFILAKYIKCPEMSNVAEGTKLDVLINIESDKLNIPPFISSHGILGKDISDLLHARQQVLTRLRRVFFKGLGNILALQERIAAEYLALKQGDNIIELTVSHGAV